MSIQPEIREDVWIPTVCGGCYACCHVNVRRVNGVAVQITGEPNTDMGARGGLCGKGAAELQTLYDPNRLSYPLKRTNPEKGIGVDPKWKRISWEEAFDKIVKKLNKARKENPQKIASMYGPGHGTPHSHSMFIGHLVFALGSTQTWGGGAGLQCGNASHLGAGMNHCSWSIVPDFKYCNYVLYFGATKGTGAGHSAGIMMRTVAEARARGMKTVVFDPICNFPGGKATEWIPIIPGTDGAVALAIANQLVNERGIYDIEFLKIKTNAPYLVKPDGHYVRDDKGEPMLWDLTDNKAKPWNAPDLSQDTAIEGSFDVNGVKCRPAFAILGEHLKQFTPERAEEISTVPAKTIKRIAKEYGEYAQIGATVEIEGVKLPYRPVSAIMFRGGSGHSNGFHTYLAVDLLNALVGACEVPGGTIAWPAKVLGKQSELKVNVHYEPLLSQDGFPRASSWPSIAIPGAWPHPHPQFPKRLDLMDLFTCASFTVVPFTKQREEIWQKFDLKYRIEVLILGATNPLVSTSNVQVMADFLKSIPFIVDINIYPSETNEGFADIVLPDASWLESWDTFNAEMFHFNEPPGRENFTYAVRQPVIKPMYERKMLPEILEELAQRLGVTGEFHKRVNDYISMNGGDRTFGKDVCLPVEKFVDTWINARFGPDRGLDWLVKKQGNRVQWKKKPEEPYWRWFSPARSSVMYYEFLIDYGKKIREVCESRGVPFHHEHYTPLLSFFPPVYLKAKDPKYDLVFFSTRDILHTGTSTGNIPWVVECSLQNPYTMKVTMNVEAAEERGLKDGGLVWIENDRGVGQKAILRTIEGQHPQTVGVTAFGGGRWAKGLPIAKKLGGLATNYIIPSEWGDFCPITFNLETATRVRVYKVE